MDVQVWLAGDGPSEIGDRDLGGERVGALEALLRRCEPTGWVIAGATQWRFIRKYEVGAAIGKAPHGDHRNVIRLAYMAHRADCAVVAFARDVDSEPERKKVVRDAVAAAEAMPALADLAIIGGSTEPALEGWILSLLGVRDSESFSRPRCEAELKMRGIEGKHAEVYVEIVDGADLQRLPPGCRELVAWLTRARAVLATAIRGAAP